MLDTQLNFLVLYGWRRFCVIKRKMEEITYIPTEIEKSAITSICNQVIDLMSCLSIPQTVLALNQLIYSFEDVSGIKATAILDKDVFNANDD